MSAPAEDLAGRVEAATEGADGRLFHDRGPGFDARALYGVPFTDTGGLERLWGPALDRLSRLAQGVGARLALLIAPDAHGVEAEALPDGRAYARPSLSDALADLAAARGVLVVHPRDALRAARGPVEVSRRTDSHWSAFGGWVAYRELMGALGLEATAVRPDDLAWGWREEAGDLGALCEPPRRARIPVPHLAAPRARVVHEAMNARRHALRVLEGPGSGAAVLLRDSYAGELAPFLGESFRRLVMAGAENWLFEDLVREERPQVLIVERGERTLPFGLVDPPPCTGWREHWPPAGEAEPPSIASDEAGASALEAAVAAAPDRWALALRLGAARLGQGRDGEARDLFARACTLAPWSGEAYEHLGYAALRLQDFALARYALNRATQTAPHRAGGWLWTGELQAAQGDGVAALATLARGLAACPADPALTAARERLGGAG